MNLQNMPNKKKEIIIATWEYMLDNGLAYSSIGDLCREPKLAQSSLYYWFDNKHDIWISAGKYGLSKIVEQLFAYTMEHIEEPRKYFDTLLDEAEKYKYELRLAVQITTSPVFGDLMREKSMEFNRLYESYGMQLMSAFNCTHKQAEVFIYSIISYVIDYAIWDDREKTQMLIENLYRRVDKVLA